MKIKEKLVILKYTMARGYQWCQTPMFAVIGAGILKPYFPSLRFYQLAIIGTLLIIFAGWIDVKFKLLNSELSYTTSKNDKLLSEIRKK